MKKILSLLLSVGISTTLFVAQTTNATESKYRFKEVFKIEATPVQSQGQTGTCWSFSGTSFFESEIQRLGAKNPVILSEMYVVRKAYELKADKFIRMDGKINFSEGGAFHDVPLVIEKFGIVPYEVYTGLKGTSAFDHSDMFKQLNTVMTDMVSRIGTPEGIPLEWNRKFKNILDLGIGKDIETFDYNGQRYTPKQRMHARNS
jgi:bleomycin hydrolase